MGESEAMESAVTVSGCGAWMQEKRAEPADTAQGPSRPGRA